MKIVTRIVIMTLVLIFEGVTIYFLVWDLPAPTDTVERIINNDRFSK